MAAVTAIALGSLALAAAGTYVSVYGHKQAAATAAATANYNAKVQESAALQSDMESRENIRRDRERNRLFIGSERAKMAMMGVEASGSPLEVLAYSAGTLELQAQDDARAATSGLMFGNSAARQTRMAGEAEKKSYNNAAAGTFLSGAASFAGQYGAAKHSGAS
jgi:hypothetical protein